MSKDFLQLECRGDLCVLHACNAGLSFLFTLYLKSIAGLVCLVSVTNANYFFNNSLQTPYTSDAGFTGCVARPSS